jgi:hypothetical protein
MRGSTRQTWAMLAVVAVSTPLALAVETLLRTLLFPPDFEEVRTWLRPTLTPWIWLTPILAAIATLGGLRLQRWYAARQLAALPPAKQTDEARAAADFDALMLSTSVPQVPALMATLGFMLGSAIAPVLAAIAIGTAGVLVQGFALGRRGSRADRLHHAGDLRR